MRDISDLVTRVLSAQVAAEPLSAEHYFLCAGCGQAIDMRSLAQTLHHLMPEHRPLTEAELTDLHPFAMTRRGSKITLRVQSEIPYALAKIDPVRFWTSED